MSGIHVCTQMKLEELGISLDIELQSHWGQ